jgi:predicted PurR-regulated permease PerM
MLADLQVMSWLATRVHSFSSDVAPGPPSCRPSPRRLSVTLGLPLIMTRLISFGVLLGLVVLFGLLSFRVMAGFLLPMLLAAMLVVIFGPMHRWIRERTRWPDWAAAGLSTLLVVLIVLAPVSLLIFRAGGEAVGILSRPDAMKLDPHVLDGLVARFNEATGLQLTAESVNGELKRLIEEWIGPIAARAPAVIAKILIGAIVTVVSLFYFFADVPDTECKQEPFEDLYSTRKTENRLFLPMYS